MSSSWSKICRESFNTAICEGRMKELTRLTKQALDVGGIMVMDEAFCEINLGGRRACQDFFKNKTENLTCTHSSQGVIYKK